MNNSKLKNSENRKTRIKLSQRLGLSLRFKYIYAASCAFAIVVISLLFFQFTNNEKVNAAATGDYRTVSSGNWNALTVWETYNGVAWVPSITAPSGTSNDINVRSTHTITINSAVTVNQFTIDAGGTLLVSSNTLTVSNGTGSDLVNNGTMEISGTVSFAGSTTNTVAGTTTLKSMGTIAYAAGHVTTISGRFVREGGTVPITAANWAITATGTYQHAMNAGSIPSLTWTAGSTCDITGITTTLPANVSQVFSNVIWNCPNQTSAQDQDAAFKDINGNFTIANTGTGYIFFDRQGNNLVMDIAGNFNITGGETFVCENGSSMTNVGGNMTVTGGKFSLCRAGATAYGNRSGIINIGGNLLITGGIFDMSQFTGSGSGKGIGEMYLKGNMTITSPGLLTETENSSGLVTFTGTSIQNFICDDNRITNVIDFVVTAGATLRCRDYTISSAGTFTLMAAGHLMIGSEDGISSSGASGNIQVTGLRSYSNNGDYTYEGTTYQASGNGLPSRVRNLTLNNSNHCVLTTSCSVSSMLTFTAGNWIATNDTLTLGISTTTLGTLLRTSGHVVGYFARWFDLTKPSNILFPIGSMVNYNPAFFSFTTAPTTAGRIVSIFIATNPGSNGLPQTDAGELCTTMGYAYWSFGAANSFAGGTYDVNVYASGFPEIYDYTRLRLIRRNNSASSWAFNGTNSVGTGSNVAPVVNRLSMTSLGHFGITSPGINPLPVELVSFTANLNNGIVQLNWRTMAEVNNDYFKVQRSGDGKYYTDVATVKGAGTTSIPHEYAAQDNKPLTGISFYRLMQIDFDGQSNNSIPIKVKNISKESELRIVSVTPNPISDMVYIVYECDGKETLNIEIINSQGKIFFAQELLSVAGKNTFEYAPGPDMKSGTYIVRIRSSSEVKTTRIVKI